MIYLEESFLNLQKDIQGYKGKIVLIIQEH